MTSSKSGPSSVDLSGEKVHWDMRDAMSYGDYLQLPELLACQKPLTDRHDETLFIIIHQASELWIKLCLHEIAGAIRQIRDNELGPAFKMMSRVARVQVNLIQSWEILSTMTPFDYSGFRSALGKSSGFQSFQYRMLEYRLGNKNRETARVFEAKPEISAIVRAALVEPSIYDEALALLARRGLPVPKEILERDFSEPYAADPHVMEAVQVYRDAEKHWDLYELAEKLVDLEYRFHLWRYSHMKTVERIIGSKPGTGGTSGVSYLKKALDLRFYPELWDVRTEIDFLGALSHIRVLDLSRVLAGPWATQILGDLGAEVIKIEKPGDGDETRAFGPPFLKSESGERGDATYFLSANRNKQSATIDFAKPEGAALIRRLARRAHVVVENFKTGALAKYGLDYASLAADNPALIYCSLTGFGHDGPYKDKAGYDYLIQGMGGLMSITGQPDGAPGAEPMKVGVAVSDLFTGLYSTIAILAALIHQSRTGEGQSIDMALFDCQTAALANQAMNHLAGHMVPKRLGNAHPNIVPYQVFATADGHMILAIANDRQFGSFCHAANAGHLADDPRFLTNGSRVDHREEIVPLLKPILAMRKTDDWIALLEAANVPCGPINSVDEVFADPQAIARALTVSMVHASAGPIDLVASPLKLTKTPPEYRTAPPLLGQHTDDVLNGVLGLSPSEIKDLRDRGVV